MEAASSPPAPSDTDLLHPPSISATPSLGSTPNGTATVAQQLSRKRKRAPVAAPSPAPSDPSTPNGAHTPANDGLLVSRHDLSSRPILTISRGPQFIPVTDGPSPEYYRTELIGVNRVGFRYVPAGINPPGHATPCRTIESNPTSYRISWEDRSPFVKVTKDGLGLAGSTGFRSARCNAPMREGKWYLEVKIVHGGGERVQVIASSEELGINGSGVMNGAGVGPVKSRKEGAHVRLGWGRREAPLNGPVGVDGYSYAYRDKTGEKITLSRPRPYGKPFGTGDVVGMYISLPPKRQPHPKDPHDPAHIKRERIPIDLKGQEVFELLEYPQSKEMAALMDYSAKSAQSSSVPSTLGKKSGPNAGKPPDTVNSSSPSKSQNQHLRPLPTLGPESKIAFFVNGECQGVAFQDLYDYLQLRQSPDKIQKAKEKKKAREGVKEHRENPFDDGWLGYYPFISLYNDACVRINPGPDFEYPPPPDIDAVLEGRDPLDLNDQTGEDVKPTRTWRPACERYPEFMQEQWALDALEEEEAKVELQRMAEVMKKEEEKAEQRRQKRAQAEARRKAKKAAETEAKRREREGRLSEERAGSVGFRGGTPTVGGAMLVAGGYMTSNHPSPSPLRYSTAAYDLDKELEAAVIESERNSVVDEQARYATKPSREAYVNHESGMDVDQIEIRHSTEERGEERDGEQYHYEALLDGRQSPAVTLASYGGQGGSEYATEEEEVEEEEVVGHAEEERRVRQKIEYVKEEEEEEEEHR